MGRLDRKLLEVRKLLMDFVLDEYYSKKPLSIRLIQTRPKAVKNASKFGLPNIPGVLFKALETAPYLVLVDYGDELRVYFFNEFGVSMGGSTLPKSDKVLKELRGLGKTLYQMPKPDAMRKLDRETLEVREEYAKMLTRLFNRAAVKEKNPLPIAVISNPNISDDEWETIRVGIREELAEDTWILHMEESFYKSPLRSIIIRREAFIQTCRSILSETLKRYVPICREKGKEAFRGKDSDGALFENLIILATIWAILDSGIPDKKLLFRLETIFNKASYRIPLAKKGADWMFILIGALRKLMGRTEDHYAISKTIGEIVLTITFGILSNPVSLMICCDEKFIDAINADIGGGKNGNGRFFYADGILGNLSGLALLRIISYKKSLIEKPETILKEIEYDDSGKFSLLLRKWAFAADLIMFISNNAGVIKNYAGKGVDESCIERCNSSAMFLIYLWASLAKNLIETLKNSSIETCIYPILNDRDRIDLYNKLTSRKKAFHSKLRIPLISGNSIPANEQNAIIETLKAGSLAKILSGNYFREIGIGPDDDALKGIIIIIDVLKGIIGDVMGIYISQFALMMLFRPVGIKPSELKAIISDINSGCNEKNRIVISKNESLEMEIEIGFLDDLKISECEIGFDIIPKKRMRMEIIHEDDGISEEKAPMPGIRNFNWKIPSKDPCRTVFNLKITALNLGNAKISIRVAPKIRINGDPSSNGSLFAVSPGHAIKTLYFHIKE